MGIDVRWVAYGEPAAAALREAVEAAKADDVLAPVTVIVPSNYVGVATRRALARRPGGVAAVSFLTIYRLGELLGAATLAADGRRPVSTPVLTAAVRGALRSEPGLFAAVAAHPATEEALVVAYRELRDLTSAELDRLARTGQRAADVVRIHRHARARLEDKWYDEQDLLAAATGTIAASTLGTVIIHLPDRLTPHGIALLGAIADHTRVEVTAGTTGDERADADPIAAVAALTGMLDAPPPVNPYASITSDALSILTTSDADDEVRAAVRAVVDAARSGTPLERMAILFGSPEPYARIVHEQMDAAGVLANGASVVPVGGRVLGRALLDLLALGDTGFRRQDVFTLLAEAPVLVSGRWTPTTAWERVSREAGVVAGRAQWEERLASLSEEWRASADVLDSDETAPEWLAERRRGDAARADELRAFIAGLADALDDGNRQRTWTELVGWCRRLIHDLLGDERERRTWPDPERRAAERVEAALDRIAALDLIDDHADLAAFRRTLAIELDDDLGRTGRFGEGVLVGGLPLAHGLDLDLVIVLGAAEGLLPTRVLEDPLLPDRHRAVVPALTRAAERVHRQHRALLAAIAAGRRVLITHPRGDLRRNAERTPSRWLVAIARHLTGVPLESAGLARLDEPWFGAVPSFTAAIRSLDFPATEQEHRLRSLEAEIPIHGVAAAPTVVADAVLRAGTEVVLARRSDDFTRFDGNLSGLAVPSPLAGVVSATRLEAWAKCPHAYLLEHVLRIDEVENPEEVLELQAIDRGSLVHTVLEAFLREVLSDPATVPSPDTAWTASHRRALAAHLRATCRSYESKGLTGRPIFWHRDQRRLDRALNAFLDADTKRRADLRRTPHAAEAGFGVAGSTHGPVDFPLPDGRTLRFRGSADRIDVDADGALHIIDYKVADPGYWPKLTPEDPDRGATHVQLAVYGVAARAMTGRADAPVHAEYWFTGRDPKNRFIGYEVDDDVLNKVGANLATVVDGIEAGVFPAHPTELSTSPFGCAYCNPDGLGTVERRREFERKRAHPLLARYADLAEPVDG